MYRTFSEAIHLHLFTFTCQQSLSGGCGGSALRGRQCRNAFLLPELLAEPVFRAGCRRSSAPVPNGIFHCGRCTDGSAVPGAFCPWAATHLPFYDAVWDRLRIAFVQAACGFEPTDSICAALRLRYTPKWDGMQICYKHQSTDLNFIYCPSNF